jgi:hypothetical protein
MEKDMRKMGFFKYVFDDGLELWVTLFKLKK